MAAKNEALATERWEQGEKERRTKVEEPVGGGGHGHGLGANGERVDLTSDDPCERSPGGGEVGDEDADEGDENALTSEVLSCDAQSDSSDDDLRDGHSGGTLEEEEATSEAVDGPDTGESHNDVDDVGDDGDDEGVPDAAVPEERGTVVEDEVDTNEGESVRGRREGRAKAKRDSPGELLERLDSHAGQGAEAVATGATAEAVQVARSSDGALVVKVGGDLSELLVDLSGVDGSAEDARERLHGVLVARLHDQPARGLRDGRKVREVQPKDEEQRTSGRTKSPPPRMAAQMNWMPMGMR